MSVPAGQSDAELIAAVRAGTVSAYGTLYERHCEAARNLTCQLAKSDAEADDLVSEAFARVFNALCTGKGPGSAFRAYLLTTLWHVAHDVTEDLSEPIGKDAAALAVPFADTAVGARREGVRLAARTLAGSAVAHRDRTAEPGRGRAAARTDPQRCLGARLPRPRGAPAGLSAGPFVGEPSGRLPGDGLPQRERVRVENHLDGCESCRALASKLVDINGGLRMIIAPIVLGGAAPGYLATVSAEKAAAAAGVRRVLDSRSPSQCPEPVFIAALAVGAVTMTLAAGGMQRPPAASSPIATVSLVRDPKRLQPRRRVLAVRHGKVRTC
ncbi:sigma factor [Amycolatopsis sp. M39]|uniref:sigma factor n=1 Tax=Amycolatopsis TaxID=1813 RepID=UPI0007E21719|nr:RNA polymerase sigma factor [Amycolatopsis sp. M39]